MITEANVTVMISDMNRSARGPRPGNSESLSVGLGVADIDGEMTQGQGRRLQSRLE